MPRVSTLCLAAFLMESGVAPVYAQQTVKPVPVKSVAPSPVNLSARGQTLESLLHSLNTTGQLRLEAAQEAKWEGVTVFAHGQSLQNIKNGLSNLLHYTWVKEGDPPAERDTLTQGQRARQIERDLLRANAERGAAPLLKFAPYGTMPIDDARELRKRADKGEEPKDPALRHVNLTYLTWSHARAALELLTTLTPEQRDDLLTNERSLLSWNTLDDHQRALVTTMAEEIGKNRQNNAEQHIPPFREGEKAADSIAFMQQAGILLYVSGDPISGAVTGYGFGLGGERWAAAVLDAPPPTGDLLPVRGNPYTWLNRANADPPTYADLEKLPFPRDFTLEPGKLYTWNDVLEKLAACTSLPLYSDAYTFLPFPDLQTKQPLPDFSKMNLAQGLDALCQRYRRCWWHEDGALLFRSRVWFRAKQYTVPAPVVALLQQHLKTQGRLDSVCLDALSGLTDLQLLGLNVGAVVEKKGAKLAASDGNAYTEILGNREGARAVRDFLQIFRALDATQKQAVLSDEGLPLEKMPSAAQQELLHLMLREQGSEIDLPPKNVLMRVNQQPQAAKRPDGPLGLNALFVTHDLPHISGIVGSIRLSYRPNPAPQQP